MKIGLESHIPTPHTSLLATTVIGSWPKPSWLSSRDHDTSGWTVGRDWQFEGEELGLKQDEATEWALREQEETGVDIISDGEIRRDNYIYYLCRNLGGFDFENPGIKVGRSGTWEWSAPTITGPITAGNQFLASDFRFVRNRSDRRAKMTIPGPMTIIDSTIDNYYGDEVALAIDLAEAIHVEVQALVDAGCDIVQFDEPAFARYPRKTSDWGIRMLETCFEGMPALTSAVHICRGYPIEGYSKADTDGYTLVAPMLANSKIDQVSIEAAQPGLGLEALELFGGKAVVLGLVDVGDPRIETVKEIEDRITGALDHTGADQLLAGPDCGMVYLDPEVAKAKLTNVVEAARIVRNRF